MGERVKMDKSVRSGQPGHNRWGVSRAENNWARRMLDHSRCLVAAGLHDPWDDERYVRAYERQSDRSGYSRLFKQFMDSLSLPCHGTVLDIGAGPGTLALPLAEAGHQVTAVEPCPLMARRLRTRADSQGLTSIRCIEKKWEDVFVERDLSSCYNLVLASFSLMMNDVIEALNAMRKVSIGTVCIVWHSGAQAWERLYQDIFRNVLNIEYRPVPKAEDLMEVLEVMDIQADVSCFADEGFHRFHSRSEAVETLCMEMSIERPWKVKTARIIETYLATDRGDTVLRGKSPFALITWRENETSRYRIAEPDT
jgi:SAM-dependent methyltransferase